MMLMNKIYVVNSNMSHLIGMSDSNLMFKRTGSMSVKQVNYNFLHQMRLSLFFQLTLFCTSFIYYIKKLKIDFFFAKKENHLNLKALLFLVLGRSLEWCWCKMVKIKQKIWTWQVSKSREMYHQKCLVYIRTSDLETDAKTYLFGVWNTNF